ncbi:hypothetical protein [Corynebacterium sanguinis]|uniref:hypothetical protein n=1 Tax=Corynebacterium sanguinis TaxID=2594913 RepID=UPI00223BB3BF|nr:hypothetical protein [Corynebacterium sanguinis]MCT1414884.1 hypothetical protein [Corynebacterium sanguinis]
MRNAEFSPHRYSERWARETMEDLRPYQEAKSYEEVDQFFRSTVEKTVREIVDLIGDSDAFDIIELMRMREFSIGPDPRSQQTEGCATHVELIAAILLSRGRRVPNPQADDESNPHFIIDDLHYAAARLLRAATFSIFSKAKLDGSAIALLTADYQTSKVAISNFQFDDIRLKHDRMLFEHSIVSPLLQEHLGYSFEDLIKVRGSIKEISSKRFTKARDESGEIFLRNVDKNVKEFSDEENRIIKNSLTEMMFRPAPRATLSVDAISEQAGLSPDLTERILQSHAQRFDTSIDAPTRVLDILAGDHIFQRLPLVQDEHGDFAVVANEIGSDTLRQTFEREVNRNQKQFRKYDQKARKGVSEALATRYLRRLFPAQEYYPGLKYLTPVDDENLSVLREDSELVSKASKEAETDGLFVLDDVAMVLEVKAKSITSRARQGYKLRMQKDLKNMIQEAEAQATRLRKLIQANGGIWKNSKQWIDLSSVSEVYSVVALLDDAGPAAIQTLELQEAGLLESQQVPWVVSIHDLAVLSEILERPEEFVLYLRTRTDVDANVRTMAVDELDILTAFLDGSLQSVENHQASFRRVPIIQPSNGAIDVWMQRHDLPEGAGEISKPVLEVSRRARSFVLSITRMNCDGWLSASVDALTSAMKDRSGFEEFLERHSIAIPNSSETLLHEYSYEDADKKRIFSFYTRGDKMGIIPARNKILEDRSAQRSPETNLKHYRFLFNAKFQLEELFIN